MRVLHSELRTAWRRDGAARKHVYPVLMLEARRGWNGWQPLSYLIKCRNEVALFLLLADLHSIRAGETQAERRTLRHTMSVLIAATSQRSRCPISLPFGNDSWRDKGCLISAHKRHTQADFTCCTDLNKLSSQPRCIAWEVYLMGVRISRSPEYETRLGSSLTSNESTEQP